MINLKLLTKGLRGNLTPSEFITLFVIESALGKDNEPKKLYNDMIADLTGLSVSQVKRCTKSLVEKQFILKQIIQKNRVKRETFYTLNLNKNESKNNKIEFTGEPSKQYKTIENNSNQSVNNIKQFETIKNNNNINYKTIETELKEEDNRYNTFKEALELQLIANAKQVAVDNNIIL